MAGQMDVAILEKENLTASGFRATALKRPADEEARRFEQVKKKALRPSTRVHNIPNGAKEQSQPVKPAVMGPPPPRIPARIEEGAALGPSKVQHCYTTAKTVDAS